MHELLKRYLQGAFVDAYSLVDNPEIKLAEVLDQVPELPRGWYELARLSTPDRIEFVRGFWLSRLPYNPHIFAKIKKFFDSLLELDICIVRRSHEGAYEGLMVYERHDDQGFFWGRTPAEPGQLAAFVGQVVETPLPEDYLSFLTIHDGFGRGQDTGLFAAEQLPERAGYFHHLMEDRGAIALPRSEEEINPARLIPFYQSFGMDSFQCFYAEWYPENEMGNVYYSALEHSLSDYRDRSHLAENLAFPTFLDWLVLYLESVGE